MSAIVVIVVVVVLVALNGLFVAAEFAIVAAPRTPIEKRAAEGHRSAGRVAAVLRSPERQDRWIATAQLGITLASLGLGMYGEHEVARLILGSAESVHLPAWLASHGVASLLSVLTLTFLHIVLGEMVPKGIALASAERAVLALEPIMTGVQWALLPAVVALNGVGNRLLLLLGVHRGEDPGHAYSPTELRLIVRESGQGGLLPSEAAQVVDELLEFGELTAREVMVPRVHVTGIEVGAALEEILAVVRESPHTRYPVYARSLDQIVGMVHVKDVLRRVRVGAPLRQVDYRRVPFVPETMPLDDVLSTMRREGAQMVVVMDEHGGTAGILTIDDLFEEVIGPLDDDMEDEPSMIAESEDRVRVLGSVRVEVVGEHFELELEHEEVDTVSGLVLALLGRPPAVGDAIEWDGFRFDVLETEGNGVARALVTKLPRPVAPIDG